MFHPSTLSANACEFVVTSGPAADTNNFLVSAPTTPATMAVVDPLTRKLDIPTHAITETQALSRVGTPSVCMLYLSGRCRQGARCHQVHADPATVLQLREQAQKIPTCCVAHCDVNAGRMQPAWLTRQVDVNGVAVPVARLAFTIGLEKLLKDGAAPTVRASPQLVCRLHISNRCRYAEDCKFLHVCREEVEGKLAPWVQPMPAHVSQRQKQLLATKLSAPTSPLPTACVSPATSPSPRPVPMQNYSQDAMWMPQTAMPQSAAPAGFMMVPQMVTLPATGAAAGVPTGSQYVMMVPVPMPMQVAAASPSPTASATVSPTSFASFATPAAMSAPFTAAGPFQPLPMPVLAVDTPAVTAPTSVVHEERSMAPSDCNGDDDASLQYLLPSSLLDDM
jgi:hypothetical protein